MCIRDSNYSDYLIASPTDLSEHLNNSLTVTLCIGDPIYSVADVFKATTLLIRVVKLNFFASDNRFVKIE